MKNKQSKTEDTPTWVSVVIGICLFFLVVGITASVKYLVDISQPRPSIFEEQEPEQKEQLKIRANEYTHIQFFDGSQRYSTSRSVVDFVKVQKVAEALNEKGEVLEKYTYEGIELEGGETRAIRGLTWLKKGDFETIYLPLGKGTDEATFLCASTDETIHGKVRMTIENSEQRDVFIIENDKGELEFIDHYEDCQKVYQLKTL